MNVFKIVNRESVIPKRATSKSAGYDISSSESKTIKAEGRREIRSGITVNVPDSCIALIFARSGLSTKKGIRPCGLVEPYEPSDSEITLSLFNNSQEDYTVNESERIAQMVFIPKLNVEIELSENFKED